MIGERVQRVEDRRFLTGRGCFLADVNVSNLKHAAILRSPVAHARIVSVDTSAAAALDGVVAVFTGGDLLKVSNPIGHRLPLPGIKPFEYHVMAIDKVRFVGEPVAIVVATDRYVAEDALELISIVYDELPAVVDPIAALASDAPLLFEEWGSNEYFFLPFEQGDCDGAFASADGTLSQRLVHHRVSALPLEGAGVCGYFDRGTARLTLYASNQQPHNLRTVVSDVTGLSEANIRVVAPDMGGGFGNKQHFIREESLIAVVALQVECAVMWSQDRVEALTSGVHSRDQIHDIEVAYRTDGRILAMRANVVGDLGNPSLYFIGAAPQLVTMTLLTGTYDIPNVSFMLKSVVTCKATSGAYRGFGQPQALFTIERIMDLVAARCGIDPVEVRRRNLIPDSPRPFRTVSGFQLDVGSFHEQLDDLLGLVDYPRFREQQEAARAEGRYIGIGIVSLVEATAPNLHGFAGRFGGFEMARVTVYPDGHVGVAVGTKSQGQAHETVFGQVAAAVLTVPLTSIVVLEGDTDVLPYGMGTWGSRSAVMGGGAVLLAARKIADKMRAIAAHMLDEPSENVALVNGSFVADDKTLPFAAVAEAAYLHTFLLPPGVEMGLTADVSYDPGNTSPFPEPDGRMNPAATYSTAAAAVTVEVDPLNGEVEILDAVMVHDCGTVINPAVVDGQIQGGFAQGVGAVLYERLVYDDLGQPLTTTLLDYRVPRFGAVPLVRIKHRETPSVLVGGFRGAGEASIITTPAAIANAVEDALRPLGIVIDSTDLRPDTIRRLVRTAKPSAG